MRNHAEIASVGRKEQESVSAWLGRIGLEKTSTLWAKK